MNIAFVLYPQVLTTGISVPMEMFNAANQVQKGGHKERLSMTLVSHEIGPVSVTGGLQLMAEHDFKTAPEVDWIFLPPMWGSPWQVMQLKTGLADWLIERYQQGTRIVATGTGVGVLAMTGLLDEKVATTHWYYLKRFKGRFQNIQFQDKHFITHQDGLYCAGSINAQTDLVLYFIERQFGEEALTLVEQQFMHELKRSFSTPFYEPGGSIHDDEVVSMVQSWVRSNFQRSISVKQMALVADQSERQLRRRFNQATGESPQQYLQHIRIEEAQALLRETNLSAIDISLAVGYQSAVYFAYVFKKTTSLTPGDYRKMVRNKQFSS